MLLTLKLKASKKIRKVRFTCGKESKEHREGENRPDAGDHGWVEPVEGGFHMDRSAALLLSPSPQQFPRRRKRGGAKSGVDQPDSPCWRPLRRQYGRGIGRIGGRRRFSF